MMTLGLTLTYFTARSNLVSYAFIWETGRKSFNEKNKCQTKVTQDICLNKNSDPRGLSAAAPGLYTPTCI